LRQKVKENSDNVGKLNETEVIIGLEYHDSFALKINDLDLTVARLAKGYVVFECFFVLVHLKDLFTLWANCHGIV
jgi:hypothetical protein